MREGYTVITVNTSFIVSGPSDIYGPWLSEHAGERVLDWYFTYPSDSDKQCYVHIKNEETAILFALVWQHLLEEFVNSPENRDAALWPQMRTITIRGGPHKRKPN